MVEILAKRDSGVTDLPTNLLFFQTSFTVTRSRCSAKRILILSSQRAVAQTVFFRNYVGFTSASLEGLIVEITLSTKC